MTSTLEEIIESFCHALRHEITPDIDTFVRRYPEHAETLQSLLPTLLTLDTFAHDTTGLPHEIDLPLPMLLTPDYQLERTLGHGGMGTVFAATQRPLNRPCAVKVLARHLAQSSQHRNAFIREARLIAQLHHPHIVKVFSTGETEAYAYYVMELLSGKTLENTLPTSIDQLLTEALQAAQALHYAHQCGIVHCDIKPSNLLLDTKGNVLIGDFGLARLREPSENTNAQTYLSGGTHAYLSPECQATHHCTTLSDQYAYGVTFYERLQLLSSASPELSAIFKTCCAKAPEARYRDMEAVIRDLQNVHNGETVSVYPAPLRKRLRLAIQHHPRLSTFVALILIIVPIFIAFLMHSHQQTRLALNEAKANLAVAEAALTGTFEYIGETIPNRNAATLLNGLLPYYRDILQRSPIENASDILAEAEGTLAHIALATGDIHTAVDARRKQYELTPIPVVANQLADALLQSNERTEAIALYRLTTIGLNAIDLDTQIEALHAHYALAQLGEPNHHDIAWDALQMLLVTHPQDTRLRHLELSLQALRTPTPDITHLEKRLALANDVPTNAIYGIALLETATHFLQTITDVTPRIEDSLAAVRQRSHALLAQWPDDPNVLLTVVRFTMADCKAPRHNPKFIRSSQQSAEQLSGILSVLLNGSSLPEDVRTPLFESLFTQLLTTRHQLNRKQHALFQRKLRKSPHQTLPPPPYWHQKFPPFQPHNNSSKLK